MKNGVNGTKLGYYNEVLNSILEEAAKIIVEEYDGELEQFCVDGGRGMFANVYNLSDIISDGDMRVIWDYIEAGDMIHGYDSICGGKAEAANDIFEELNRLIEIYIED